MCFAYFKLKKKKRDIWEQILQEGNKELKKPIDIINNIYMEVLICGRGHARVTPQQIRTVLKNIITFNTVLK